MRIDFADERQKNMVNDYPDNGALSKYLKKRGCPAKPEDILTTLEQLAVATTPLDLPKALNYHLLSYNRSGTAAIDILIPKRRRGRGRWRMVFTPVSNCDDINKKISIERIIIEELAEDYHRHK